MFSKGQNSLTGTKSRWHSLLTNTVQWLKWEVAKEGWAPTFCFD